jgi:hypothetical protein
LWMSIWKLDLVLKSHDFPYWNLSDEDVLDAVEEMIDQISLSALIGGGNGFLPFADRPG